ncbi:MAG: transposase zinc-binding domain-containing protein [Myxococcota bacterium]
MTPLPATSNFPDGYVPRHAQGTPLFRILQDHLETFLAEAEQGSETAGGFLRPEVRSTLEKYMECGVLRFGFARIHCDDCGHEELLPLSCRFRGFCPSCHARRLAEWSDWVLDTVLPDVRYRQWVLSWPKRLRVYFLYDDDLFRAFSGIIFDVLTEWMQTVLGEPDARPAMVVCDQTFGTLLDYHPHSHMIVSHGVFRPDGTFVEMTSVRPEELRALERVLASRLLTLLVRREKLRPEDRKAMLSWPHLGFTARRPVGCLRGCPCRQSRRTPAAALLHLPAPVPARRDHL